MQISLYSIHFSVRPVLACLPFYRYTKTDKQARQSADVASSRVIKMATKPQEMSYLSTRGSEERLTFEEVYLAANHIKEDLRIC